MFKLALMAVLGMTAQVRRTACHALTGSAHVHASRNAETPVRILLHPHRHRRHYGAVLCHSFVIFWFICCLL